MVQAAIEEACIVVESVDDLDGHPDGHCFLGAPRWWSFYEWHWISLPVSCNAASKLACTLVTRQSGRFRKRQRQPWPGATPDRPEGFWHAEWRPKRGRSRPQNGFCRVTLA